MIRTNILVPKELMLPVDFSRLLHSWLLIRCYCVIISDFLCVCVCTCRYMPFYSCYVVFRTCVPITFSGKSKFIKIWYRYRGMFILLWLLLLNTVIWFVYHEVPYCLSETTVAWKHLIKIRYVRNEFLPIRIGKWKNVMFKGC